MIRNDLKKIKREEYANKIYYTSSVEMIKNNSNDRQSECNEASGLDLNLSQESLDDIKKIR